MKSRRTDPVQFRLIAIGSILAALGRLSAEFPAVVEFHRASVFPRIASLLQTASGGAASTRGEVAAIVLIGLALTGLILRRGGAIGSLAIGLGLGVLSFYGFWGLSYRYPPLSERLSRATAEAGSLRRFLGSAERSAALLTRASKDAPDFSGPSSHLLARINRGLVEGLAGLPVSIDASPVRGVAFGPAKASRVSFALSLLQLSGYYFPWTGEAQINSEMPRSLWPRVAAHEKAHQRGFAREDEATVIGVLACLSSREATVFYGGALGLFVAFDRELARINPEARPRIWAGLPQRVADDLRSEAAFWKLHEGLAGAVSEKVNDTYLKAQGVKSGVGSYLETTRLFLQAIETPGLQVGALLEADRSPGVFE